MPDFIVDTHTASPRPSPGGMGDGTPTEMHYFANAQRNPWRWGTDYVHSGDTRWKNVTAKLMNFFVAKTGGNPNNLGGGYHLNGADTSTDTDTDTCTCLRSQAYSGRNWRAGGRHGSLRRRRL